MAGGSCIARLTRRPAYEDVDANVLRRCLSRWELGALGVGSSLGAGVYAVVGYVALRVAGPAVVVSFAVAGVAALLAGLCYAEFSARVPRAGSAYHYAFVSLGEATAFAIGWSIMLESLFGAASMARGLSLYVDSLTNGSMSGWFRDVAPIDAPPLSPHFDLLAFLVVVVFGVILCIGVRESMIMNNVLVCVNLAVIIFIIIAGAVMADASNWSLPAEAAAAAAAGAGAGAGGFLPYGAWGALRGAAVCFYGYVGFDVVTFAAEETREPRRSVPLVIILVIVSLCAVYCSVATVLTMMLPYYLQENITPVVAAFSYVGWDFVKWPISIGAIIGISSSMFGALYALPRLLYAMAADRLLFPALASVAGNKTPVVATLLATGLISVLASVLELEQLVLMMCVGTLLSYTVVAASVIVIRYQSEFVSQVPVTCGRQILGLGHKMATRHSSRIVNVFVVFFTATCLASALVLVLAPRPLVPAAALHGAALLCIIIISLQPGAGEKLVFKTPLVPLVPCLSIYFNVHLMVLINWQTWVRVIIWMIIGIPIYFFSFCCWKRNSEFSKESCRGNVTYTNGNANVQIVVAEATPPASLRSKHDKIDIEEENVIEIFKEEENKNIVLVTEEIVVKQALVDFNEEKEATIIDLLDKVIQAEEDSYKDTPTLGDEKDEVSRSNTDSTETIPHRMSLSELSDAGSDVVTVLSKYDVIAQVHREDLPKVYEETNEETDAESNIENEEMEDHEKVTFFNESETNSRTDESGYFDTTDETTVSKLSQDNSIIIPNPPPLDENYFASPTFIKSYTIPARPKTNMSDEKNNIEPRVSVQSNGSYDDSNIVFGSTRQMKFMSKLNHIFQTKMTTEPEETESVKSNSTGNVGETYETDMIHEKPAIFLELKKELLAKDLQTLRPTTNADRDEETNQYKEKADEESSTDEEEELSRTELKSKLENLFAAGRPSKLKSRPKSHPPTLDESSQLEVSSTENLTKLPKVEKNDTLKRQKDKFGEVLNSLKSLNKTDLV